MGISTPYLVMKNVVQMEKEATAMGNAAIKSIFSGRPFCPGVLFL